MIVRPRAAKPFGDTDLEVDDRVPPLEQFARAIGEDRTTAERDDSVGGLQRFANHRFLDFTKPRLSVMGEDLRDRPTRGPFDLGVGIDQLEFECLRETSTDGRFAGTGADR